MIPELSKQIDLKKISNNLPSKFSDLQRIYADLRQLLIDNSEIQYPEDVDRVFELALDQFKKAVTDIDPEAYNRGATNMQIFIKAFVEITRDALYTLKNKDKIYIIQAQITSFTDLIEELAAHVKNYVDAKLQLAMLEEFRNKKVPSMLHALKMKIFAAYVAIMVAFALFFVAAAMFLNFEYLWAAAVITLVTITALVTVVAKYIVMRPVEKFVDTLDDAINQIKKIPEVRLS